MYQFRKKQSKGVISLPAWTGEPTESEIIYLLGRGQENKERFVELPWKCGDPQQSFSLTVKCSQDQEPTWTLYRGQGKSSTVAFSYQSGDIGLVLNMVLMELDRKVEVKEDAKPQDVYKITMDSIDQDLQNLVRRKQLGLGADEEIPEEFVQAAPDRTEKPEGKKEVKKEAKKAPEIKPDQVAAVDAGGEDAATPQFHLEGHLKNISVSSIFTYISMGKMTGRLSMESAVGAGEIYFEFGFPKHASTLETRGEQAFYELFGWSEGEYNFFQGEKANQRTIEKTFDELMEEAEKLLQMAEYLESVGLTQDAYLKRSDLHLSDEEFEKRLPDLEGWQLVHYSQIYSEIDGKKTLFDLLRLHPMVRSEWLPLIYNLIQSKLVTHTREAQYIYDSLQLKPVELDFEEIEMGLNGLNRQDTAIMQPVAFLYFVRQEFWRYERSGSRFALMAFEIGIRTKGAPNESDLESLTSEVLEKMGGIVSKTKRKIDVFGHYDQFKLQDYLVLLPGADSYGAAVFANRVQDNLQDLIKEQEDEGKHVVTHFGAASVPSDCKDMGLLLAAALEAKRQARTKSEANIVMFSDLLA